MSSLTKIYLPWHSFCIHNYIINISKFGESKISVAKYQNFKEMGTVIRSSPAMCRNMVQYIDSRNDLIIVELGAGDGVITKYILDKMSKDAKLFVFEINPELCEVIASIKDDRLILINDGAQYMESILLKYEIETVDTIISAIPF